MRAPGQGCVGAFLPALSFYLAARGSILEQQSSCASCFSCTVAQRGGTDLDGQTLTSRRRPPADFVSCLNATGNDAQSCTYYLDMLKQCQAAAAPY